jgi:recombination protein RecT
MTTTNLDKITAGDKPASAVAAFSKFMDKLKPQLSLALPKHLNPDRMTRLALTAFSSNADLQKCAPNSIAASIMTAAQLGLEPGINGQCYLIPYFDKRANQMICTLVPGWKGLVDLVNRSGRASVWTGVVFKNHGDHFDYQLGDEPFCRHRPSEEPYPDDAQWTHVYAVGRVRDSVMPVIEVWSRAKVQKHLNQYNKVGGRHYALANDNNYEMYGRKVALLQVLKYMPSSIELQRAVEVSNAADQGLGAVLEGDFVTTVHSSAAPEPTVADPDTGEITSTATVTDAKHAVAKKGAKPAPALDFATAIKRAKEAKDREILNLMADEWRDLPDGDDKDQLMSAFRARDAELAQEGK